MDFYQRKVATASKEKWWRILCGTTTTAAPARATAVSLGLLICDPGRLPLPVLVRAAGRPSDDLHLPEPLLQEIVRLGERALRPQQDRWRYRGHAGEISFTPDLWRDSEIKELMWPTGRRIVGVQRLPASREDANLSNVPPLAARSARGSTMPSTLVFPDGIRLASKDEIPGPEPHRSEIWARVQSANIAPGYVLTAAIDRPFTHYAEINVDGPHIWAVFRDLCLALLGPSATLIAGEASGELVSVGSANVRSVIAMLEPHRYQLAHDGFLQYALVSDRDGAINEVLVAPEKHFKIWTNDDRSFRQVMQRHDIRETEHLEFLDEYPRTMVALPASAILFHSRSDLVRHFEIEIGRTTKGDGG